MLSQAGGEPLARPARRQLRGARRRRGGAARRRRLVRGLSAQGRVPRLRAAGRRAARADPAAGPDEAHKRRAGVPDHRRQGCGRADRRRPRGPRGLVGSRPRHARRSSRRRRRCTRRSPGPSRSPPTPGLRPAGRGRQLPDRRLRAPVPGSSTSPRSAPPASPLHWRSRSASPSSSPTKGSRSPTRLRSSPGRRAPEPGPWWRRTADHRADRVRRTGRDDPAARSRRRHLGGQGRALRRRSDSHRRSAAREGARAPAPGLGGAGPRGGPERRHRGDRRGAARRGRQTWSWGSTTRGSPCSPGTPRAAAR